MEIFLIFGIIIVALIIIAIVVNIIHPELELFGSKEEIEARMKFNEEVRAKSKKEKSVVKSAAIGAVVAGPAGAVVGAVYAADKNNKERNKK